MQSLQKETVNDVLLLIRLMKPWEKGHKILKDANKKSNEFRRQVDEIMKNEILNKENYEKIKELLEKEASIRNQALEKVEKIHREETKNLEQQWEDDEN